MADLSRPRPLEQDDEREAFDCGQPSLDAWFRRNAWRNQQSGVSRTTVIADADGMVAGYVSLSTGEIRRDVLSKPRRRNMPDPVPVFLLGQLAVDRKWQGEGLSSVLMSHAILTVLRAWESVGAYALLTHPVDAPARRYYDRRGFSALAGDARGAMILRLRDLAQSVDP